MNSGFAVLKLQELGLKVDKIRVNRWTDVKHYDGHTYGYIINTNKNICSWIRRGTDEKGSFGLDEKPFNIPYKTLKYQMIQEKHKEQKEYFNKAADLAKYYFNLEDIGTSTPYLTKKKVGKYGCKTDKDGNIVIPLRILVRSNDGYTNAYIKTIQTIKPDGTKLLSAGGQKKGAMGLINFKKGLIPRPENKEHMDKFTGEIVIAEGYATAATIAKLTNYPCVMAIDAGNMLEVAKQIILAYPKARIIIAADNDLKLRETIKGNNKWVWSNTGVEAAINVQQNLNCYIAIPDFNYVKNIRLTDNEKLTDWNDFINKVGTSITTKIFFNEWC